MSESENLNTLSSERGYTCEALSTKPVTQTQNQIHKEVIAFNHTGVTQDVANWNLNTQSDTVKEISSTRNSRNNNKKERNKIKTKEQQKTLEKMHSYSLG